MMIYQPNTQLRSLTNTNIMIAEFDDIWCVYKPHNIASTQGKRSNIIDLLITQAANHPLVTKGLNEFGLVGELGMLTRLDYETAGLLWFAKSIETKSQWLDDQQQGLIAKIYIADLMGWLHEPICVQTPIMHHRNNDSKMIPIHSPQDMIKGRSHPHQVSTHLIPLAIIDSQTQVQAIIHQGCRHQIRLHCADYGLPIVGDTLYHKSATREGLHLWSVGIHWQGRCGLVMIDQTNYSVVD